MGVGRGEGGMGLGRGGCHGVVVGNGLVLLPPDTAPKHEKTRFSAARSVEGAAGAGGAESKEGKRGHGGGGGRGGQRASASERDTPPTPPPNTICLPLIPGIPTDTPSTAQNTVMPVAHPLLCAPEERRRGKDKEVEGGGGASAVPTDTPATPQNTFATAGSKEEGRRSKEDGEGEGGSRSPEGEEEGGGNVEDKYEDDWEEEYEGDWEEEGLDEEIERCKGIEEAMNLQVAYCFICICIYL